MKESSAQNGSLYRHWIQFFLTIIVSYVLHPMISIADTQPGFVTLDVIGKTGIGGTTNAAVTGSTVYLGAGSTMQIVDFSDPEAPLKLGELMLPSPFRDADVQGDFAYVTASESGLLVVDVSDPAQPAIVGNLNTGKNMGVLRVAGNYVYVANDDSVLSIIDVSNRTSPAEMGMYTTGGLITSINFYGDYVLVTTVGTYLTDNFFIIDPADPQQPEKIGSLEASGGPRDVFVSGQYAYVANMHAGLRIVDLSDPAQPRSVSTLGTPGTAYGIVLVEDKYAFVTDGFTGGVRVIDVEDPLHPVEVGFLENQGNTNRIDRSGDYIYYLLKSKKRIKIVFHLFFDNGFF